MVDALNMSQSSWARNARHVYARRTTEDHVTTIVDIESVSHSQDVHVKLHRVAIKQELLRGKVAKNSTYPGDLPIWVMMPVNLSQKDKHLRQFMDKWREKQKWKLKYSMNILILPVFVHQSNRSVEFGLSQLISLEGIYSIHGETRKVILFQNTSSSIESAYRVGVRYLKQRYSASVLFLTSIYHEFDLNFLRRCHSIASTKAIYLPIAKHNQTWLDVPNVIKGGDSVEDDVYTHSRQTSTLTWRTNGPEVVCLQMCAIDLKNITISVISLFQSKPVIARDPGLTWLGG